MFYRFIEFPDDLEISEDIIFRLESMAATIVQNACHSMESLDKDSFEEGLAGSIALHFQRDIWRRPENPGLEQAIEQFVLRSKDALYQYVVAHHGTTPDIELGLRELLEICDQYPSIGKMYGRA